MSSAAYGSKISGQVYVDGQPVKINNVTDAIKAGLAYASEDRKRYGLNLIDDIKHNTTAAALRKISRSIGVVNQAGEYKVAEEYRRKLNTKTPTVDAGVGKLSGGNQQKVVLAWWRRRPMRCRRRRPRIPCPEERRVDARLGQVPAGGVGAVVPCCCEPVAFGQDALVGVWRLGRGSYVASPSAS